MVHRASSPSEARNRAPELSFQLANLVWPLTPSKFVKEYWQRKLYIHRGPPRRLRGLVQAIGGTDIRKLASQCGPISALTPSGDIKSAPIDEALDLLDQGRTLQMRFRGALLKAGKALSDELGIIDGSVFPGIYVTKDGGLPPHWSQNDSFTIQLEGTKRWWVSERGSIDGGLQEGYEEFMDGFLPGQPIAPRRRYWRYVTVTPGTMIYVPRGHWHATRSPGPSLSLNLLISPRPWADVIIEQLRWHLLRFPEWRRTAKGSLREQNIYWAKLREEIAYLTETRAYRRHRAKKPTMLEDGLVLRRSFQGRWRIEHIDASEARLTVGAAKGEMKAFRAPVEVLPLCRWLGSQPRLFSVADCRKTAHGIERNSVDEVLRAFLGAGFLEPVTDVKRLAQ